MTSALVAAVGTVATAGVMLFAGSGPASGSTVPATVPVVVYQAPAGATPILVPKSYPTMIVDHWQCNEISCTPIFVWGH